MVVIKTMVGEMEIGEANWGDEGKYAEWCRVKPPDQSNIRVIVKIRPPNERELALPGGVIVNALEDGKTIVLDGKPPFVYDVAFPFSTSQLGVFEVVGVPIVQTAYNGFNASMFAYGQTASGKSFSMMGVRGTELVGLSPRIAHLLFYVVGTTGGHEFYIEGSYLEIYNEKLKDLLSKRGDDLKVRENPELGVHVAGLTKVLVKTSDDCEKLIEDGTSSRTVAATKYNSESSRSHAVFELHIQHKYKDDKTGEDMQARTKIALIDLAGSERSDKLGSVGKALQEGNNINKSLTVLGRCIKALVEQANNPKKKVQVPFRESVLTYYLRESLAGNARTTMLAACSPAGSNQEETMSTLRYAASAKMIKTAAKKSEDPLKAKVRELNDEVDKLKAMLAGKGSGGGGKKKTRKTVMGHTGAAELESLSEEEKQAYLKQLEEQMEMMGMGGFAKAAAKVDSAAPKKKKGAATLDPRDVFPQLSCLNKDDLLSHAMVIPLQRGKLSIGRSDAQPSPNDFELDGVGMCARHCVLHAATDTAALASVSGGGTGSGAASGEGAADGDTGGNDGGNDGGGDIGGGVAPAGASVALLDDAADLHVNGAPCLHGTSGAPTPLVHLDRLVIGPCRIVCLYLTQKLTPLEKAQHTYAAAFREFMAGDDRAARLLMSPQRQALLDEVHRVEGSLLQDANGIAHDLCCAHVGFSSQLLVGAEGLGSSTASLDDVLARNECRVKVVCHFQVAAPRVATPADLLAARRAKEEVDRGLKVAKSERQLLRQQSSGLLASPRRSFAEPENAELAEANGGSVPSPPGSTGGGAPGNEKAKVEESSGGRAATLLRAESLGALSVNEVEGDEDEAQPAAAPAKVLAENILFEMEADHFADLLSELKVTHHGLSQLLGGVQAGVQAAGTSASMARRVFDAVDTDRSGLIDK